MQCTGEFWNITMGHWQYFNIMTPSQRSLVDGTIELTLKRHLRRSRDKEVKGTHQIQTKVDMKQS